MAKQALINNLDQAIPFQYLDADGQKFRWLRRREEIIMDDSRMHQSITDLYSKGHVTIDNTTTKDFTSGWEAI